jgi:beta-mannosidase
MLMNRLAVRCDVVCDALIMVLIATSVLLTEVASAAPLERIEIASGWAVKSFEPSAALDGAIIAEAEIAGRGEEWLAVGEMPAMVHDILLRQGKIENPLLPRGLEKCAWVATKDWVYAVQFPAGALTAESRLCFRGLAAKTDVYLNGNRIATHDDKLTGLSVDVTGRLQSRNTLVLHVHAPSPLKEGESLPTRNPRNSTYLGPNPGLSTLGVFDRVFLEVTHGTLMTEVVADASLDESLTLGTVTVDVSGITNQPTTAVKVRLIGPDGAVAAESLSPAAVRDGTFQARSVLTVKQPQLWWLRGYGDPTLYRVEVSLRIEDQKHQAESRTIGFRRIDWTEPMHFRINGVPVFLRGGDWVTPNLLTDVWDQARHDRLFDMAENANFNAFRIWGVEPSPQDPFYEMADARGFLLWQDFTQLPMKPDPESIAVCTERATRMIKRLKHHPSILSWCGCNEAAMWWHEDYRRDFTDRGPWEGLAASEAVEAVCRQLDPDRHYQPSAPYGGENANDPREGSTNGYTNMWFVPGYDYLNFATEDTRIAAPVLHSLKRFMAPEDLWPEGYNTLRLYGNTRPFPESWLPYTTGSSWKKTGPVEQFYDADDAAGLVYRLGMAESLYYRDTVERQRRGRPGAEPGDRRCSGGYLVWKYNDSWPQVYSAKVDYFLEPYHVYYELRRAYAPVLLSFDFDTYIYLWAVNDTRAPVSGTVRIQLYHLEQEKFRKEIIRDVTVAPGKSKVVVRLDQAGIRAFRKEHLLFATLTDASGNVLARTNALADIERRLTFPEARLTVTVEDDHLAITTDKFARSIHLDGDADGDPFGWFFEDNYFDLLPGETKIVRILGDHRSGTITARAWFSPHTTTVDWER